MPVFAIDQGTAGSAGEERESHAGHAETARQMTCPMCGKEFTCSLSASCWCSTRVVPDEVRARLAARYQTCVCSACLDSLVGEQE